MYSPKLIERLISSLASDGYTPRAESEACYAPRTLHDGAEVVRVAPSPTGFVHIGTIYTALINEYLARQSGGVFILRVEDTDKKREVPGALQGIIDALHGFAINYQEGPGSDARDYAPYLQSERGRMYLGFAIDLLQKGRAYPCFATSEELEAAVRDQQARKQRPGYYGEWALWRDRPEQDVAAALDAGKPFVLRFRSEGSHDRRVQFDDALKGRMELPENDLDVPLIKSDEHRLPTYHLAHVVDDYLMRVTLVLRGDEWLPSTPLHIELTQALGIAPFRYAHLAPISIIDKNGGGKRKLSKRKDPEADVQFWLQAGYPVPAIKAYLLGLANSSFEDWYRANPEASLEDFPLSLQKLAASRAPLLDMAKLEDYAKDYIASLPQDQFNEQIRHHADGMFKASLDMDAAYTSSVLAIERSGDKPRKDLSKWADAKASYGYFFDELFETDFQQQGMSEYLADVDQATVVAVCEAFLQTYDPDDDQQTWFDKVKKQAEFCGFATDNKAYKANPEAYKGNVADFARILRVKLTGLNRTPDLWTIMQVMGLERVRRRLGN